MVEEPIEVAVRHEIPSSPQQLKEGMLLSLITDKEMHEFGFSMMQFDAMLEAGYFSPNSLANALSHFDRSPMDDQAKKAVMKHFGDLMFVRVKEIRGKKGFDRDADVTVPVEEIYFSNEETEDRGINVNPKKDEERKKTVAKIRGFFSVRDVKGLGVDEAFELLKQEGDHWDLNPNPQINLYAFASRVAALVKL